MMSQARIMVVEDARIVSLDLTRSLRSLGYEVVATAASGERAVLTAAELLPDLVLMDIHLEGEMDGITAAAEITSAHDTPVVYVTAYADDKTLARAKVTQPYAYVLKPVDKRELQIAIEVSLQLHREHMRLAEAEAVMRQQAE